MRRENGPLSEYSGRLTWIQRAESHSLEGCRGAGPQPPVVGCRGERHQGWSRVGAVRMRARAVAPVRCRVGAQQEFTSCAALQELTNGTHKLRCAAGTHKLRCAAGTHKLRCAAGIHKLRCAAGTHKLRCAAGTHQLRCAAGAHKLRCAEFWGSLHGALPGRTADITLVGPAVRGCRQLGRTAQGCTQLVVQAGSWRSRRAWLQARGCRHLEVPPLEDAGSWRSPLEDAGSWRSRRSRLQAGGGPATRESRQLEVPPLVDADSWRFRRSRPGVVTVSGRLAAPSRAISPQPAPSALNPRHQPSTRAINPQPARWIQVSRPEYSDSGACRSPQRLSSTPPPGRGIPTAGRFRQRTTEAQSRRGTAAGQRCMPIAGRVRRALNPFDPSRLWGKHAPPRGVPQPAKAVPDPTSRETYSDSGPVSPADHRSPFRRGTAQFVSSRSAAQLVSSRSAAQLVSSRSAAQL
eukprot:gene22351-biopygen22239